MILFVCNKILQFHLLGEKSRQTKSDNSSPGLFFFSSKATWELLMFSTYLKELLKQLVLINCIRHGICHLWCSSMVVLDFQSGLQDISKTQNWFNLESLRFLFWSHWKQNLSKYRTFRAIPLSNNDVLSYPDATLRVWQGAQHQFLQTGQKCVKANFVLITATQH